MWLLSLYNDKDVKNELHAIFKFGIPLMITFLLGVGNKVIDVWFVGNLSSEMLAVVSLGNLFTAVVGLSVGNGILTAIDTLVAQAFTGASNPYTIGIILQRSLLIMYIFGVFISILWIFSDTILLSMGQSPELSKMAHEYILYVIPDIFLSFTITSLRKFLQGLGEMKVTMYLILFVFPINIVSNYFFLIYLNLGYIGAAYHIVFIAVILLSVYLFIIFTCTDVKRYWPGLTNQAFCHWGEFLKLGIPGMLSVSTDWAFEVCAIIAGVLGATSLAAQSVVLISINWLLMIPNALKTALVVRLGHHLGANEPKKTKLCVILTTVLGFMFVTVNSMLLYIYRSNIAYYFTTDEQVIIAIKDLMHIGSLAHFALGVGIILSGTLNAFGKQSIVALINIISYYIIGFPVGLLLTSRYEWGLNGIWTGVVLSGLIKSLCEAFYLLFIINWEQECILAVKRIHKQEV
ncbi:mate-domain-containing protein [Cokeromyces recurvatus]|uniref:mate-domain-containing protein n=1 Tax=Cokeromyces recurvatus TaxID=90255 RepID=UPI00221E662D|nr:mate-domain-containing protein [Cokeromyces recurvatus]KAI7906061.1 mate-domain-containing protein [Cokeromyces recurvatus]